MPGGTLIERFIPAEEVPAIFQRASIIALPYLDATQSGVAALAATYGRPVVASRTGGLPEMVREGLSGLLVEPGDPDQLANAIRALVEQPALAANLAAGARQLARTDLSWEAIAERTMAVYLQARGRSQHQAVQGSMA
jgi:glycosyltransferase involved in cell wall biosynthesis